MSSIIKVDQIQLADGSTPSVTDLGVSGNPVHLEAYMSGTASYDTADTFQKIPFDTIRNESGGSNFDTSSSRFTAPTAGIYLICAHVYIYSSIKDTVAIYKNGSRYTQFDNVVGNGAVNPNGSTISHSVQLNATDYIEIFGRATQAGIIYTDGSGGNQTYLSIVRLS